MNNDDAVPQTMVTVVVEKEAVVTAELVEELIAVVATAELDTMLAVAVIVVEPS